MLAQFSEDLRVLPDELEPDPLAAAVAGPHPVLFLHAQRDAGQLGQEFPELAPRIGHRGLVGVSLRHVEPRERPVTAPEAVD